VLAGCPATGTPTRTSCPVSTSTFSPTYSPTRSATRTPTSTTTPCAIPFTDVHPTDYFFPGVTYLYCKGAISGYQGNVFLPYNNTTRGQLTKIVVLGYSFPIYTPPTPTFNDVSTINPFYQYIETAYHLQLISGYTCGSPGEPCPGLYFRPNALLTRGQLCKITVLAAGWEVIHPTLPTFNYVLRRTRSTPTSK